MNNIQDNDTYKNAYFVLEIILVLITAGTVVSKTLITIADVLLVVLWLAFGIIETKSIKGIPLQFSRFFTNKSSVIFSMIFVVCIVGLFYSSNTKTGTDELVCKLPLLIMPLVFSGFPKIKERTVNIIITTFCASLLYASIVAFITYSHNPYDYRQVYSHVNTTVFGFFLSFGIILLIYELFKYKKRLPVWVKTAILVVIAIFLATILIKKSLTGITTLIITSIIVIFTDKTLININRKARTIAIITILLLLYGVPAYFIYAHNRYYSLRADYTNLPEFTVNGNRYRHDIENSILEEGNYNLCYLCEKELAQEWPAVSGCQWPEYKDELIRYLNSINYTKDSAGVHKLTDNQIKDIKHGIANANYTKLGFYPRFSEAFFCYETYKKTGCPTGSILSRIGAWSSGLSLIKEKPLFGYGTGEVVEIQRNRSFELFPCLEVTEANSHDVITHGILPHNQYIFFTIQSGIIGLTIIVLCFILPGFIKKKNKSFLWKSLLTATLVVFFFEDILGRQTGVTMISTFYFIFLLIDEQPCEQKQ